MLGLMFFNYAPSQFFPGSQIDVVHFPAGPGADSSTEKTFKGPLHTMLQDALSHIRSMIRAHSKII
jgi:ATP-dependent DNA helicase RecG